MATTSMQAHRDLLLSRSDRWSRGYRNTDLTNEQGCNCRGFTHRGQCAHVEAVKAEAEKARAAAVRRPKATYEDLFSDLEDTF